jgi:ribosomal protein L12E/L44/L45/RPP1/RPP2
MRLIAIIAAAAFLMPAAIAVSPAASGLTATQPSDLSAQKKKKPAKKKKEENLKAAPGTGPSGPSTKY